MTCSDSFPTVADNLRASNAYGVLFDPDGIHQECSTAAAEGWERTILAGLARPDRSCDLSFQRRCRLRHLRGWPRRFRPDRPTGAGWNFRNPTPKMVATGPALCCAEG